MIKNVFKKISILLLLVATFFLFIANNNDDSRFDIVKEAEGAVDHSGGYVYFLKPSTWTQTYVMMFIGHDSYTSVYQMTKVSNTDNLYRYTMPSWGGATYIAFANASSLWDSGYWGPSNRTNATHYTNVYNNYRFDSGSFYVWEPASTANNAGLKVYYKSSASNLNLTTRADVYSSSNNGSTYSSSASAGTVSVSGYYMSAYNTASTRSEVLSTSSTAYASTTLAPGSTATFTATANDGYHFVGWSTSASEGNIVSTNSTYTYKYDISYSAKTIYALFKANTYYVGFNANGGTGSMSNQSFTYGIEQNLDANTFERDGYTFKGWDTDDSGETIVYTDGESVSNLTTTNGATFDLYAVWYINTTFDFNGGLLDGESSTTFITPENESLTISDPSRDGYVFKGWNTASDGSGETISSFVADGNTYYAQWHIITTFDWNYDGGSTEEIIAEEDADISNDVSGLDAPTRSGFTFAGWYDAASGGAKVTEFTADGGTYYAYWYVNTTFNWNYEGAPSAEVVKAFEGETITPTTPTRTNAEFAGWYDSEGNLVFAANATITADGNTYYAYWTFTTTFISNMDGVEDQIFDDLLEGKELKPTYLIKPGKEFIGWYDSSDNKVTEFTSNGETYIAKWVDAPNFINFELIIQYYYTSGNAIEPEIYSVGMKFNSDVVNTKYNTYVNENYRYVVDVDGNEIDAAFNVENETLKSIYSGDINASDYKNYYYTVTMYIYDENDTLIFQNIDVSFSVDTLTSDYIIDYLDNNERQLTPHEYSIIYNLHSSDLLGHKISNDFSADETHHWYACTVCQNQSDYEKHNFNSSYSMDADSHWHECSKCGYVTDEGTHIYEKVNTDITYFADEANCTRGELYYYSCECGHSSNDASDSNAGKGLTFESGVGLGHEYDSVMTDATCTAHGYTTYTCSRCGDTYEVTTTSALGHDFTIEYEWNSYTATAVLTCNREGCSYSERHDATVTSQITTEATCEGAGIRTYTAIYGNYNAGANLNNTKEEVIAAKGHTAGESATCTSPQLCTVCKKVLVAALGHTPGDPATCTTSQVCTVCGATLESALGHSYSSVVTAPTCTTDGYTTHTCTRTGCSYSYKDSVVTATGHKESSTWSTDANQHWKICTVCNTVTTAKTNHSYTSSVTVAATCTTKGTTKYTCSCGYSYTSQDIAALGHNYTTTVTAPTCTAQGYTTHTCTRCNNSYVDTYTSKLGHNYSSSWTWNGYSTATITLTCSRCSGKVTANGTITSQVTKAATCTATGTRRYTATYTYENITYTNTKDETLAIIAHTAASAYSYDSSQHWKECTVCSGVATTKTNHSYTSSVAIAATCTTMGTTKYTCSCGYSYTSQNIPINSSNHSYSTTTTWDGKNKVYICTLCNKATKTATTSSANNTSGSTSDIIYGVATNSITTIKFKGTINAPVNSSLTMTAGPKVGVRIYYDSSNYLDVTVAWNGTDRNYEAYSINVFGYINDTENNANYFLNGCGILPATGGTLVVRRYNNTLEITVKNYAGTTTYKTVTHTVSGMITNVTPSSPGTTGTSETNGQIDIYDAYKIQQYNIYDTWTCTNTFTIDSHAGLGSTSTSRANWTLFHDVNFDYTLSFKYTGTVTGSVSNHTKIGAHMAYVDGSNYAEGFVEWKSVDRAYEICSVATYGMVGGTSIDYTNAWCDGCGFTPSEGGTITIQKSGTTFKITYTNGSYTKTTSNTMSITSNFDVIIYADYDKFAISDITFTKN